MNNFYRAAHLSRTMPNLREPNDADNLRELANNLRDQIDALSRSRDAMTSEDELNLSLNREVERGQGEASHKINRSLPVSAFLPNNVRQQASYPRYIFIIYDA